MALGEEIGKLYYDIDVNDKGLRASLDDSDNRMSKLGHTAGVVGKAVAAGLAVAAAGAIAFGVASVKAFTESQDIISQTNAVLKSTGGIAGVTAGQVSDLSKSLQKVTKFSDETIQSGENLLLTFTNIGKDIFPQATETMLNMSQALGQDVKSSAIQLGKALQDPILGVTALRRVGVNFNKSQQDVITKLVETGHAAQAQAMILKELQTEFGGSARAAGDTFAGKLAILKNNFNDVQEVIGRVLVNGFAPLISRALEVIAAIDWEKVIQRTKQALIDLWQNHLVPIGVAIGNVATQVWNFLYPSLEALWNTISTKLIPTLNQLWHDVIEPLLPIIGVSLVAGWWLVINVLNIAITVISSITNFLLDNKAIVVALAIALSPLALAFIAVKVAAGFSAVLQILTTAFTLTTTSVTTLTTALSTLSAISIAGWAALVAADLYLVKNAADAVKGAFDAVLNASNAAANLAPEGQMRTLQQQATAARARGDTKEVNRIANALKALGGNAAGTDYWKGGLTWVGERGPEIVNLPRGSQVIPNDKVGQMAGGGTTVNIGVVQDRQDADYILDHLDHNQQLRGQGLSPALAQ